MLSSEQIKLLENYRDKSYVSSILCDECCLFYSRIKNFVNIPLILSSSIMTVLNSGSFDSDTMKIPNIVLNAATALLLSLINNFKLPEKIQNFKNISVKMNKLCHAIEDKLSNDIGSCNHELIRQFINEYDTLNENLDYPYVQYIKNSVKKRYAHKRSLPNSLNCEETFIIKLSNDTDIEKQESKINENIIIEKQKSNINENIIIEKQNSNVVSDVIINNN